MLKITPAQKIHHRQLWWLWLIWAMHYHFADLLKQFDAFDPPQNRIGTSRIKKIPSEMDVTLLLLLTLFTLFILFNTVHTIQTALHRLS